MRAAGETDQETWPSGWCDDGDMTDYRPSPELADALAAFTEAKTRMDEKREALRAAVANELKTNANVTNDQLAGHLPWTNETIRGIAREYGVPPKRKPTVRSIKPKRRTTA